MSLGNTIAKIALLTSISALCLAGCSTSGQANGVVGSLTGIGSGTQESSISAWQGGWTKDFKGTSVQFSPDGDDVGRRALLVGQAHFAALDSQLTSEDWQASIPVCGPDGAFAIPAAVVPIGVAYNVSGAKNIRLDRKTLADIYSGQVKSWDDVRIQQLNPDLRLPRLAIKPFHTASQSALTSAVTEYLSSGSGDTWLQQSGSEWPPGVAGEAVARQSLLTRAVEEHEGAIAFMDRQSISNKLSTAELEFGGNFVKLTDDNLATAVADSTLSPAPGNGIGMHLPDNPPASGYSLAAVTYQAFCHSYKNRSLAALVTSWANYVVSESGQTNSANSAQVVSPSERALQQGKQEIGTISSDDK